MNLKNNISQEYVAWIDIMGSGILMRTSVYLTQRAVETLHNATAKSLRDVVQAFPMNDGVFLQCSNLKELKNCIKDIFSEVTTYNEKIYKPSDSSSLTLEQARKLVLVRGCVAFGPTVTSKNSTNSDKDNQYGHVILGPAVSNAYAGESFAGPFGIYVHESARMHGKTRYRAVFMRYDTRLSKRIVELLKVYYKVAEIYPYELSYKKERQEEHKALSREFFREPTL